MTDRHTILSITGRSPNFLHEADALVEFDAVIVDQLMSCLASDQKLRVPPSSTRREDQSLLHGLRAAMGRRTTEAETLLLSGGLLVIRLMPLGFLVASPTMYVSNANPDSYSSADWWIRLDGRLGFLRDQNEILISAATGGPGRVEVPGHGLEPYLRDARYTAVLTPFAIADDGCTVLAINRGGEAIAAEFKIGKGLLLLVPSGGDDALLERCVHDLLDLRSAYRDDWRIPAEQELLDELAATDLEHRTRHEATMTRLHGIWAQKREVFEQRTLTRVLDYFRTATAQGTSRRQSMEGLHQMVECLEDEFGGETSLRSALGLTKKSVEAIKHVANKPEVGARHVDKTEPRDLSSDEMAAAIAAATEIAQAYIEYRMRLSPSTP